MTPVSYDLAGASAATGYSERTISDAIARGNLIAHVLSEGTTGAKKVIRHADLDEWVRNLPVWKPRAS